MQPSALLRSLAQGRKASSLSLSRSSRGCSLEVGEVVGEASVLVGVQILELLDLPIELVTLHAQRLDLLLVRAAELALDAFVEGEVFDDGGLLVDLDLGVVHELGARLDLALQRGSLRDRHAELSQLVKDLEVRHEGHVVGSGGFVADLGEDVTLDAVDALVDARGDALEPRAVHIDRIAILDGLGEVLRGAEESTVRGEAGVGVLGDEFADAVEDLAASAHSSALALLDDLPDPVQALLVARLQELGLGLEHALDELLDVAKLLRGFGLLLLRRRELLLDGLQLPVRIIELGLDLFW